MADITLGEILHRKSGGDINEDNPLAMKQVGSIVEVIDVIDEEIRNIDLGTFNYETVDTSILKKYDYFNIYVTHDLVDEDDNFCPVIFGVGSDHRLTVNHPAQDGYMYSQRNDFASGRRTIQIKFPRETHSYEHNIFDRIPYRHLLKYYAKFYSGASEVNTQMGDKEIEMAMDMLKSSYNNQDTVRFFYDVKDREPVEGKLKVELVCWG